MDFKCDGRVLNLSWNAKKSLWFSGMLAPLRIMPNSQCQKPIFFCLYKLNVQFNFNIIEKFLSPMPVFIFAFQKKKKKNFLGWCQEVYLTWALKSNLKVNISIFFFFFWCENIWWITSYTASIIIIFLAKISFDLWPSSNI